MNITSLAYVNLKFDLFIRFVKNARIHTPTHKTASLSIVKIQQHETFLL